MASRIANTSLGGAPFYNSTIIYPTLLKSLRLPYHLTYARCKREVALGLRAQGLGPSLPEDALNMKGRDLVI